MKLPLVELMIQFPVGGQLLDGHLLSEITGLLLSDGSHKAIEVHHLSLDPVPDMLEWVL